MLSGAAVVQFRGNIARGGVEARVQVYDCEQTGRCRDCIAHD